MDRKFVALSREPTQATLLAEINQAARDAHAAAVQVWTDAGSEGDQPPPPTAVVTLPANVNLNSLRDTWKAEVSLYINDGRGYAKLNEWLTESVDASWLALVPDDGDIRHIVQALRGGSSVDPPHRYAPKK